MAESSPKGFGFDCDVAIVGAGAAGLMAAIFAARGGARVVALDSAKRIGAKILISGGGRCNITHDVVRAEDFNGSRKAIAKVLRTFSVDETVEFFAAEGVAIKREETGKLFPVTNRAATVLDALLRAARNVEVLTDHRVQGITASGVGFDVMTSRGAMRARRVVLAAGGRSVPKTGSDGSGYALALALGHQVSDVFPALVPLVLQQGHWMTGISGTSVEAELAVRDGRGRVLHRELGSMLFTHFGVSGPVVLDISRHWIAARAAGEGKHDVTAGSSGGAQKDSGPGPTHAPLTANFLPRETFESIERATLAEARRNPRATIGSLFRGRLPERLVEVLAANAGVTAQAPLARLERGARREFVRSLIECPIPVERDRGFDFAEVTAGGVPLMEIDLATMASRKHQGLYLCGEILDVDGKIGGFNFQWAWASGRLAGMSVNRSLEG